MYTHVGKKELNEHADKWKFCMRQKSQVRLSLTACFKPSIAEAWPCESETRSLSIRAWARSRSVCDSHLVVNGVSGSSQKPNNATTAVAAPSTIKSLGKQISAHLGRG